MGGKDLQFSFIFEAKNKVHNLDNKNACQERDIPVKIIKDNIYIFVYLFSITSIIRYLMRLSIQY